MKSLKNGLLVTSLLTLAACGGGSSSNSVDIEPPIEILTGTFTPVPIGGLSYSTPTESGVTNASGEFQYLDGETIEFNLGDTVLGSTSGASELSLFDLRSAQLFTDVREIVTILDDPDSSFTAAVNLIRTLYSLDDDQDPTNGININADVVDLFASVVLAFNSEPTRFAYSDDVQTLLSAAGRTLMPLEVSLADQYQAAGVLLTEGGINLGRLVRIEQTVTEGDLITTLDDIQYDYDLRGNLVRREEFEAAGLLLFSEVIEYDAQGLRMRRTLDVDGDGLIDFETELQRNRAGDVLQAIARSGNALADQVISMRIYNELGQEIERTEDQDGDGSVERTTKTQYASNGRPVLIEVDSDGSSDIDFVITNTYDGNARLIEQSFEGVGIDVHNFQDNKPPPIAEGVIDSFDAQSPYWGIEPVFLTSVPSSPVSRRTLYTRDSEGRVIERSTDRNEDGVPDQLARLVFEDGLPVSWQYDGQGDGAFESQATYTYSNEGILTTARENLMVPNGVARSTRTIEGDEEGRRARIDVVSNPLGPGASEMSFIFSTGGRLALTISEGEVDETQVMTWENSFRLDDSRFFSLSGQ